MKLLQSFRYYSFGTMSWLFLICTWLFDGLELEPLAWLCCVGVLVTSLLSFQRAREMGPGPVGKVFARGLAAALWPVYEQLALFQHRLQVNHDWRVLKQAMVTGTVREIQAAADTHIKRITEIQDRIGDGPNPEVAEVLDYFNNIKAGASQIVTRRVFGRD